MITPLTQYQWESEWTRHATTNFQTNCTCPYKIIIANDGDRMQIKRLQSMCTRVKVSNISKTVQNDQLVDDIITENLFFVFLSLCFSSSKRTAATTLTTTADQKTRETLSFKPNTSAHTHSNEREREKSTTIILLCRISHSYCGIRRMIENGIASSRYIHRAKYGERKKKTKRKNRNETKKNGSGKSRTTLKWNWNWLRNWQNHMFVRQLDIIKFERIERPPQPKSVCC